MILLFIGILGKPAEATIFFDRTDCVLAWLYETDEDPTSDSTTNGFDGTSAGNPTHTTASPPKVYSAGYYDFDGNADEFKVFNAADPFDKSNNTLVNWVNPDVINSDDAMIILTRLAGANVDIMGTVLKGTVSGDPIRFTALFDTAGQWDTDDSIATGAWIHIGATYNKTATTENPTIYLDGVAKTVGSGLTETVTPVGTINTGGDHFVVGETVGGAFDLNAQQDEVGYFDSILTSTDINNIMDSGLGSDDAPTVVSTLYGATLYGATIN